MAGRASGNREGRSSIVWTICAAAASLILVEASAGVAYVGTGLGQVMVNILGWMPALSLIPLRLAEHAEVRLGVVELMWRAVPLGVTAFLVVFLGLNVGRQGRIACRPDAKG